MKRPSVVSLFTGAGGLDLGLECAGFSTRVCVEIDEDARRTLRTNRRDWKLTEEGDVHKLTPEQVLATAGLEPDGVYLLAGGPPCQPFSKAGYWANGDSARLDDPRANTLAAFLKMMEAFLPQVVLIENVSGLTFRNKDEALKMFKRELRRINRQHRTRYRLHVLAINAADYGVPQIRERIFLMAEKGGRELKLPPPRFHGPDQDGESKQSMQTEKYRTAWDAIGDLNREAERQSLRLTGKWAQLIPSIPEGMNYLWHTKYGGGLPLFGWRSRYWSFLLKLAKSLPSWTLQAEPGPATGPFHWDNRLLSVRELCRLQTFPDAYRVLGTRRIAQRQIGNAVPPAIGEMLGLEIRRQFLGHKVRNFLKLIPAKRRNCPPPERRHPVSAFFKAQAGKPKDHPGTGKGPRARLLKRKADAAATNRASRSNREYRAPSWASSRTGSPGQ